MRFIILIVAAMLISVCVHSQLQQLQETQKYRVMAKDYAQQMLWDSACHAYRQFAENAKYSNPYDHVEFAYCNLKMGDTISCTKYLSKALKGGIDTVIIRRFFRKLTDKEQHYVTLFLRGNFEHLHEAFRASHDTALIEELKCILEMDQMGRNQIEKLLVRNGHNWSDSNIYYLSAIQYLSDSINYSRIVSLFESGKFPGYHSCGSSVTDLGQALMHLDFKYANWDFVFRTLKTAVLNGEIDPDQTVGIVDRHYLGSANPTYYYGRLNWGSKYPLHDCKNVDELRSQIGIESLRTEYERKKRPLPECYQTK